MPALQPGRGIGDQREGGGVALGEAVAAEALELPEGLLGEVAARSRWRPCRRSACRGTCETPPVYLKVAIDLRSWSASPGVKPAHSIATRIACSWNSGTPSVLPSTFSSSGFGIVHRLLALAAAEIGMHHVALDRAGPDDRHLDDEIVEGPRLHAAAASTSAPGSRSGRCRACRPCGSSRRCAGPRPGWWRDRARCPCARPGDRSRASCR